MALRVYAGSAVNEVGAMDMVALHQAALRAGAVGQYSEEDVEDMANTVSTAYYSKLPATYRIIVYLDSQHSDDSEFLTGFAVVGTRTRRLTSIYVHPQHWRRGVGRALLDKARPWMDTVECTLNAAPFFAACGMHRVGDVLCEVGSKKVRCAKFAWPTTSGDPAGVISEADSGTGCSLSSDGVASRTSAQASHIDANTADRGEKRPFEEVSESVEKVDLHR
eukprot:TRINITY_DN100116_c0_g1_i1.p1 TRINITY_DN100116_c0_g1~~TRINITY_DN100116_c0_g1_i1.p1  ORF type:complete len:221 (-),score=24.15 TRINITY_DN100116_c0_g1_i1:8-670(-)